MKKELCHLMSKHERREITARHLRSKRFDSLHWNCTALSTSRHLDPQMQKPSFASFSMYIFLPITTLSSYSSSLVYNVIALSRNPLSSAFVASRITLPSLFYFSQRPPLPIPSTHSTAVTPAFSAPPARE